MSFVVHTVVLSVPRAVHAEVRIVGNIRASDLHRLASQVQDLAQSFTSDADQWAHSASCAHHEDNPCCHVRTGAGIAAAIRQAATPQEDQR